MVGTVVKKDDQNPHGPEELRKLPIRMLSVIVYSRTGPN